jgi:saccharopine dehydrogenase-like NADP-dependent oxidoreductase
MQKKVVVLGAGMVGRAMALDLAKDFQVTSVDRDQSALDTLAAKGIHTQQADLSNIQDLSDLILSHDIVVGAVPGFMGYQTLEALIKMGRPIVDISFFPEDALTLDALARENNCIAIVDIGVAPGMDNIILGYHAERMQVDRFECLVGGLPRERKWPFEYKAPFSPIDVIEEYTRPARFVEEGRVITKPALSDQELIHFDGVGTLESFNSDGLRSLIQTMDVPNMIEKTLRYPGHARLMEVFRESGFFSEDSVQVGDQKVRPIDLSAKLLFEAWKLGKTEDELTVMRVTVEGQEDGKPKKYAYHLLDRYDAESGISSMSRTTGYTATAAVHLVAKGLYNQVGISPPEFVGRTQENFDHFLNHLAARGVIYRKEES